MIVATLQPDAGFGRTLADYGGVFVARSLWGTVAGYRPDRWDSIGALICLLGLASGRYESRELTSPTSKAPVHFDIVWAGRTGQRPQRSSPPARRVQNTVGGSTAERLADETGG